MPKCHIINLQNQHNVYRDSLIPWPYAGGKNQVLTVFQKVKKMHKINNHSQYNNNDILHNKWITICNYN